MGKSTDRRTVGLPSLIAMLVLAVVPAWSSAAPLDGTRLLEPNPVTDWVAARIRDGVIKRLDLSDSQLASLHSVIDTHRETLLADAVAVKEARMLLVEKVRAQELDLEAVKTAHQQASEAELRFDDLESKFAAGELLGRKWLARAARSSAE